MSKVERFYWKECTSCGGLGEVKHDIVEHGCDGDEIYESWRTCNWCGGSGREKVEVVV